MELMERVFKASRSFFEDNTVEQKLSAFPFDQRKAWGYVAPNTESLSSISEEGTEPVRKPEGARNS